MIIGSIDIGGSSIKSGIVEISQGRAKITQRLKTAPIIKRSFDIVRPLVLEIITQMVEANTSLSAIAISTTGYVNKEGIVQSNRFAGYDDISWDSIIKKTHPQITQTFTINDGKAFAWAEYSQISPPPESFVHVVLGTGIGGGIILNGKIIHGVSGHAGYIGHHKVHPLSQKICTCGHPGCLESLAGASALIEEYNSRTQKDIKNTAELAALAQQGDNEAVTVFEQGGWWLGVGLINLFCIFNPAVITLGGGLLLADQTIHCRPYLTTARRAISELIHPTFIEESVVKEGQTDNDGGMLGAALLHAEHFGNL